jgi:hypothetical protein
VKHGLNTAYIRSLCAIHTMIAVNQEESFSMLSLSLYEVEIVVKIINIISYRAFRG